MPKRVPKHKHVYHHAGGGTVLIGQSRYPCDDQYECRVCLKVRVFESVPAAHALMPRKLTDDWVIPDGVREVPL